MPKNIQADMTLRTWPGYFRAVWRGQKKAEIRKNDRGFQVGDTVRLIEFDPERGEWISPYREIFVRISHIQHGPIPGLTSEYCVFSFDVIHRRIGFRGGKICEGCRGKK